MKLIKTARIFDPESAKKLGMIDGIMYLEKAVEKAARQMGILNSYRVVSYRHSKEFNDNLYNTRGVVNPNFNPLPKLKLPLSGLLYGSSLYPRAIRRKGPLLWPILIPI